MNLQAEKLELVQAILNIDDITLINELKQLLNRGEYDWFDDLSEQQKQSIQRGIDQAYRGEKITHEEAILKLGL